MYRNSRDVSPKPYLDYKLEKERETNKTVLALGGLFVLTTTFGLGMIFVNNLTTHQYHMRGYHLANSALYGIIG
jgi:hypothetical protein